MSPLLLLAGTAVVLAFVVLAVLGRRTIRRGRRERERFGDQTFLEELFESSSEATALLDDRGRILRANESFLRLFMVAGDQIRGRAIADLLTREWGVEDDTGRRPGDEALAAARGAFRAFDAVARKSDGAAVEISAVTGPVSLPGSKAAAFVIVRDDARKVLVDAAFSRLESALETMQLGVTITDLSGRIVYVNPAEAEMHGWKPEQLVGRDVRMLAPDDRAHRMTAADIATMGTWSRESVNMRRDGTLFPVLLHSDVVRDAAGAPMGVVTTCEDITQRQRAERVLRESEERYALAVRGANDGLWDWNLDTGTVFYSDRWEEMLGLEAEAEAAGRGQSLDRWLDRVHPEDQESLMGALAEHRAGRTERFENEHRIRHADGSWRWVLARGIADRHGDGRPWRIVGALTDVTSRKESEVRAVQEALYDPLTGLPNRVFLHDLLERSLARTERRPSYTFAVLFLDLDRFKQVNDTLGHAAGDALLVEVADRIRTSVRPGDVVCRLGGDEFCVLVDDVTGSRDATRVAGRILDCLEPPVILDGRPVLTGCSIGIALSDAGVETPGQLLRHADAAMYRAKHGGRGRFELFDRNMQEESVEALRLEGELRKALEQDQFRLVYQPVVRLADRQIIGLEALVRWQHPERGTIAPDQFVPLAEETGVMVPLGWWILEEACRRMGDWVRAHPTMNGLTISVNLSARQLRQPDLVDRVAESLARGSLEPRRLRLEVSERVLMQDPEIHRPVIRQLMELGVLVQVDDFGTGTSSLSFLPGLNVSTLKIDRSFIEGLGAPGDSHGNRGAVVQAFITLAQHLGMRVVAEGVETDRHEALLRDLKCDQGQGYLFHQPLDPDAITTLLGRRQGPARA